MITIHTIIICPESTCGFQHRKSVNNSIRWTIELDFS